MANETALRDGNGEPTLLFDDNGEVRRVSSLRPLPVTGEQGFLTVNLETSGNVNVVLLQPAPGKRITVKGAAVLNEPTTQGETRIFFTSGKLVHRVYGSDQSGYLPLNHSGQTDEALRVETVNIGAGNRAFFTVNYVEE